MDYKIFARENYNLNALNRLEISDPLVGLKGFLIGKSADQFKQNLRDLLVAVFEKHGWRQHGARFNLYQNATEVAKLMAFVWLSRAEEGRVGKECVSACRYRGSPY